MAIRLTPDQIESWIARHFEYKRRKNGDELIIRNPFIPSDEKFKFNISTVLKETKQGYKGYWVHDWRPSARYNMSFIRFVQLYKGITFKEALKEICGDHINLKAILRSAKPQIEQEPEIEIRLELPKSATPITNGNPKIRDIAIRYLKSRGISLKTAIANQIHYNSSSIIFPYLEYDSIVYWQSRSFIDKIFENPDERKVGVGKSQFLYGFDNAEPYQSIFIVEAIFCALSLGPGGVAIGGANLSESQRRKIRAINPSKIILAPDNDKEGLASLYYNWNILRPYFEIYYVLPPKPHKDWNDIIKANRKLNKIARIYAEKHAKLLDLKKAVKLKLKLHSSI